MLIMFLFIPVIIFYTCDRSFISNKCISLWFWYGRKRLANHVFKYHETDFSFRFLYWFSVNQGFYVLLPTRVCRTGHWGRRDLVIDLTHWATNLIDAEKWTVEVPIFISLWRSIKPCTYRLSASECWQVSVQTNCTTEEWIMSYIVKMIFYLFMAFW